MGTSVVPALIDALVTLSRANVPAGVNVFDGFGVTSDPSVSGVLMVGVDDPDTGDTANASSSGQSMATMATTRPRDQIGSVTCCAVAWNGNADQKAARDAAYGIVATVENFLRSDPTVGIGQPGRVVVQMGDDDRLSQNQYSGDAEGVGGGCDAIVIFTVNFKARI